MTQKTPHSLEDLTAALELLGKPYSSSAALHLALPIGEVPSIAVRRAGESLRWRDASVASGDISAVQMLAVLGWRDGDHFLHLAGDPLGWVKPVLSGAGWISFGTDVLLNLPLLRMPSHWGLDEVRICVRDLARGHIYPGGMYNGMRVVEGSGFWTVQSSAPPTSARPAGALACALERALSAPVHEEDGLVYVFPSQGTKLLLGKSLGEGSIETPSVDRVGLQEEPSLPGWSFLGLGEQDRPVLVHEESGVLGALLTCSSVR